MPHVKFFYKNDCPNCPPAKETVKQLMEAGYSIEEFNLDTSDGLAESAYYGILSTPSILIVNDEDLILEEFRSKIPQTNEIKIILTNLQITKTLEKTI